MNLSRWKESEPVRSPFRLRLVCMGMTNRSLIAARLATCMMLSLATLIVGQGRASAQATQAPQDPAPQVAPERAMPPAVQVPSGQQAQQVRSELARVLRQYAPVLSEVIQRDPSLLRRADYLAPYPALVAFLQEYPEVTRNPAFYIGRSGPSRSPEERAQDLFEGVLAGFAVLSGLSIAAGVLIWLVRGVIDQRRWSRLLATQVALHTKLTDRLTTNDEVVSYISSPAVARFLESGPLAMGGQAPRTGAPVSRIVWSLQAGVVFFTLGLGRCRVRGVRPTGTPIPGDVLAPCPPLPSRPPSDSRR